MRGNASVLCHVPQTVDVDGELRDGPGAGANLRLCRDFAAVAALLGVEANPRLRRACAVLAGRVASPFGVGVDPQLRRSQAAPAGSVAFLPGVGANPRLRRDRAAPAGGDVSGLRSQVGRGF